MLQPVQSILFATNFSPSCRAALETSISLAVQYQAKLFLLHVIEETYASPYVQRIMNDYLGQGAWESMQKDQEKSAREILIDKMSPEKITHTALQQLCEKSGNKDIHCGLPSYYTLVDKGDVVNSILSAVEENSCDLIVMGAREGFLEHNSLGSKVKGVMRQSKIPVLFVPPLPEDEH